MPKYCAASFCQTKSKQGIALHRFPRDPQQLLGWTEFVRRSGRGNSWTPNPQSLLCSLHFAPGCYVHNPTCLSQYSPQALRILDHGALPTITASPCGTAAQSEATSPKQRPLEASTSTDSAPAHSETLEDWQCGAAYKVPKASGSTSSGLSCGLEAVGASSPLWAVENCQLASRAHQRSFPNTTVFVQDCNQFLSDILVEQASPESNTAHIQTKLVDIEKKLLDIDTIENRLSKVGNCATTLDVDVATLRIPAADLGSRSRRNNLIIRGLKEEELETEEILMKKVNEEIFGNILKQKLDWIERIHRLGKKIPAPVQDPTQDYIFKNINPRLYRSTIDSLKVEIASDMANSVESIAFTTDM
ncbi:hypothetical protein HPB48_006328 [Haemaphysalis longicornis]|uniref:THAP-type domain-containing protein n=1 Tax=Haemaphysalis longicornis TaxID=44386 RepID=A0A9J6FDN7_HAELO|nr:hypothetical protein HPB48_006328 [Haemaphysalis longicornis]